MFKKKPDFSVKKIKLPKLIYKDVEFTNYTKNKYFSWNNKNIHIMSGHRQDSLYPYLGIHTEDGIFYMQNGIPWLQGICDIFVEHSDNETQEWLLECALDKIDQDTFWPTKISNLSVHNSIPQNLERLILKNFSNNNIYSSQDSWLQFFRNHNIISSNSFEINNINIVKKIFLGNQSLSYKQYKNLRIGNVILVNDCQFNLEGIGLFNLGSFAMEVLYSEDKLLFRQWKNNMNDEKDLDNEEWNIDEYNSQEDDENLEDNEQSYEEQEETTQKHPFANVPININFSLGQMKMAIEDLMQLQEGSVLILDKNSPAQVDIYANGKNIGSGEVVEVEGKIAVQIVDLFKSKN